MEPIASRPYMPAYGISTDPGGLLPWSWARERLERSRNYWVSTVTPSGAPHTMPVWGVWLDDVLYFSTADTSRKAANLRREPRCTITTEYAGEAVIVEGMAREAGAIGPAPVLDAYRRKYDWSGDPGNWLAVEPAKAFAFHEMDPDFQRTATRWTWQR